MVDYIVIIGIVTVIATFVGIVVTIYLKQRDRKEVIHGSNQSLQQYTERVAREKKREEQETAERLSEKQDRDALATKQDMKDHVDRLIHTFKQDVEMERIRIYAKMDTIDTRIANLEIRVMEHILDEKDERARMQKSIDFFQTMQYGPDAKSVPAYVKGEEEEKGHEDEPMKGVFASREDTTHKDTEDSEGNTTEEAEEQKERGEET